MVGSQGLGQHAFHTFVRATEAGKNRDRVLELGRKRREWKIDCPCQLLDWIGSSVVAKGTLEENQVKG